MSDFDVVSSKAASTDHSESVHSDYAGAKTVKEEGNSSIQSDQGASPTPANNSPSDGARDATTNHPLNHNDIERMTEERLMEDPEYRKLKEQLELCGGLEDVLLQIDTIGIANDRKICWDDVQALVNDVNQPNKAARDAAKFLNDHKEIWAAICGDDNVVSLADVQKYLTGMKDQVKGMKDTARADIKAENGAGTASSLGAATGAGAAAGSAQTGSQSGSAVMAEAGQELPKPPPSQLSGLEGASENMNNMIGWGESEIDRLTTLMGKTNDPAELKQLENKINAMSRRMQQMTALMNQVMTAMQNISKMYSEIAMNSVRNIR